MIKVRTYKEALRLSRCMEMRRYAPEVTDEMISDMYNFVAANPKNLVSMANGMIQYVDEAGNRTDVYAVATKEGLDYLIMNDVLLRVVNTASASDSSGCSGCSCNNNNNNNNNNG